MLLYQTRLIKALPVKEEDLERRQTSLKKIFCEKFLH